VCRKINEQAVCSCIPGYLDAPPNCRAECIISSDCPANMACNNQKCIDPCRGVCGIRAQCTVVNHNPICSCLSELTGDPFTQCIPKREWLMKAHNIFIRYIRSYLFKRYFLILLQQRQNHRPLLILAFRLRVDLIANVKL